MKDRENLRESCSDCSPCALRSIAVLSGLLAAMFVGLVAVDGNAETESIEVDAELVLAVDVSRSMTPRELEIQRRGYAEALTSDEVISAITSGLNGRVAITYVEWAGTNSQRIIVDWTLVSNRAEAGNIASRLTAEFDSALRRTSISGAIDYASDLFMRNGYISNRKIIDISGDGPNNQGRAVLLARNAALGKGIVINGLPLMTREGMGSQFHLDDLDEYYRQCVVGGPGAFVLPVLDWEQFPAAVRQKLVLELSQSNHLPVHKVADTIFEPEDYDCLIGEKIWEQFRELWSEP